MEFRDRFEAMEFLRGFIHDHHDMIQLRRILEREMFGTRLSTATDYHVLEQIADLLVAKKVRVVERYDLFEAGFHAYVGEVEATSAPEPEAVFADEPDEEPEPTEPPAMPDPEAQAAALERAAATGSPFCEA